MEFVCDFHLHSKYSRAVSQAMVLPQIEKWAVKKGIDVLSAADFTHPLWFRELSSQLEEDGGGIYKLKNSDSKVRFILSTEISSIYSQNGKVRRIHNLVFVPSLETAQKLSTELIKRGCNLSADGRPIIGLSSRNLLDLLLSIDQNSFLIPCHAWTPWFSLYGSNSGFDSIDECFQDLSKYIYGIETGLSCYDTETEVLTENGWKKFFQVTQRDKICTLNPNTEEIEYQKPQKIYRLKYQGKMYRLKTKRVDLLVTPNHNLLYAPADFHTRRPYRLKEARDLFGKSKILRKDGVWKGETLHYFTLPEVKMRHGSRFYSGLRNKAAKKFSIKPWLKFFGFWMAEGWTTEGENGHYAVCVSNQNYKLMTDMRYILESFGYTVFWDKKITNTIRVRDYQLFHYLRQFGKAADKHIPAEVKGLSKELLGIFVKYYIKGDGHVYGRNGNGLSATTISIRLRDDLQEIALKLGISAYYKLHQKAGTLFRSPAHDYKKEYKQSADSWNIYFIRRNRHAIIPSVMKKYKRKEEWVDYDGMVYCVSVPNRVVYIRRNGIPLWCGNSDPEMNWRIKELDNRSILSFSDAHSGVKIAREATVFELPALSFQSIKDAIRRENNSKVSYTIEFYPEEGKYHYTGHRNCGVLQSPTETKLKGSVCPVCKRQLTIGVMHRVEQLADRPTNIQNRIDENGVTWVEDPTGLHPKYIKLVPLVEILAESLSVMPGSLKVLNIFDEMVLKFSSELNILLKTPLPGIEKSFGEKIAEGIQKVRSQNIVISPGFDGEFGKVKIWGEANKKQEEVKTQDSQLGLF